MRYAKIAFLLFIAAYQLSCKGQDNDKARPAEQGEQEVTTTQTMSTVLKQQLEKGRSALYGNSFDGPSYQYAEGDLAESVQLLKDALASNGYKSPSENEFNARVKEIFGRTIDPGSATLFEMLRNHILNIIVI